MLYQEWLAIGGTVVTAISAFFGVKFGINLLSAKIDARFSQITDRFESVETHLRMLSQTSAATSGSMRDVHKEIEAMRQSMEKVTCSVHNHDVEIARLKERMGVALNYVRQREQE